MIAWEAKSKKLKDLFREELSNGMKLAVFTNMLPTAMQDYVYANITKETTYEDLKERMRAWVSNKVVQTGPTPMDVGEVAQREEAEKDEWEETEVDAVSRQTQCY